MGEALGFFDNSLGETTKIVVANVQPEKVYEKKFLASVVVAAGPVKLGITSVTDPETLQKLADPDKGGTLADDPAARRRPGGRVCRAGCQE